MSAVPRRAQALRRVLRSVTLSLLIGSYAGAAQAQVKEWPSERPPKPLAAREMKFPPYEMRTLPNGMQVIVVLHHGQPAIARCGRRWRG